MNADNPTRPGLRWAPWVAKLHIAAAALLLLTAGMAAGPQTAAPRSVAPDPPAATDSITPPQPVNIQFDLANGVRLSGRVWAAAQTEHMVLGVHGFNDYSKAFDPLARHLNTHLHATVYAYDQRGFGANPKAGVWAGTETLLADLREITQQLRVRHPNLPLTVVGESMGGALVLLAASQAAGLQADQLVLQAPAVWGLQSMPWYQRASLQFMNAVAPDMVFSGRGVQSLGITPTDDPEVARDLGRDPLVIKQTRVSSLAGVTDLMDRAQNLTTAPPQRTLVLYGLNDRIIPRRPVCDWVRRMGNSAPAFRHLEFIVYQDGWHLLTRQRRTPQVLEDMGHWLRPSADAQPARTARQDRAAQPTKLQPTQDLLCSEN